MNKQELLGKMREAAVDLAGYASYSEIVGQIGLNRTQIRAECDKVFELDIALRQIEDVEEEARLKRGEPSSRIDLSCSDDISKEVINMFGGIDSLAEKARTLVLNAISTTNDTFIVEAVDMVCESLSVDRSFFTSLDVAKSDKYTHLSNTSNYSLNKDKDGKPIIDWFVLFGELAPPLGWTWDLIFNDSTHGTEDEIKRLKDAWDKIEQKVGPYSSFESFCKIQGLFALKLGTA